MPAFWRQHTIETRPTTDLAVRAADCTSIAIPVGGDPRVEQPVDANKLCLSTILFLISFYLLIWWDLKSIIARSLTVELFSNYNKPVHELFSSMSQQTQDQAQCIKMLIAPFLGIFQNFSLIIGISLS